MRPSARGQGLSIELAITIFGVMLSYWTGELLTCHPLTHPDTSADYGMSFVKNEAQFRFPIAFQIFFALLTMVMVFFLPESPRWVILISFMFYDT
jgi:hypothetical protein